MFDIFKKVIWMWLIEVSFISTILLNIYINNVFKKLNLTKNFLGNTQADAYTAFCLTHRPLILTILICLLLGNTHFVGTF